jgi:hypothetical protein
MAFTATNGLMLGLPPRYVPAADETLAWDQLPDQEQFTHLKPLR